MLLLRTAGIALFLAATAWLAWRTVVAQQARLDAAAAAQGGVVGLRGLGLRRAGLIGSVSSHNSWSPRLAVRPEGLRFKVLLEQDWPFADIVRVDVGRSLSGSVIVFAGRRGTLAATLATRDAARRLLRALPPGPLTARAVALRDDVAPPPRR